MISGRYYLVIGRENHGPVKYISTLGDWCYQVENSKGQEVTYAMGFKFVEMTDLLWALI